MRQRKKYPYAGACLAVLLALLFSAATPTQQRTIRVAIYDDTGGNEAGPTNVEHCLPARAGFKTARVKAAGIRAGALANFDVLVQPGGRGSKQAAALGESGRAAIQEFVKRGGGYVGICAGAYLASADYSWSLGLLDAKVLDRKHWNRGRGDVKMRLVAEGKKSLGCSSDVVTVSYAQGPLLAPAEKPDIPDYELLATFDSEINQNGAPAGVMRGSAAAVRGTFAAGRVFCFSPHPERSEGIQHFIEAAVRWAAGDGAATSPPAAQ